MRNTFWLAIACLICGCQFGEKKKQVNPLVEADPVPSFVEYQVEKIDLKAGPCEADSTAKHCVLFQIEYPIITGKVSPKVIQKINASIEKDILSSAPIENGSANSVEEMIEELSNTYKELIAEFDDYEQAWLVEINGDILHQDSAYISLASTVFNYTGGAHPNNNQLYRSYNLETGEAIKLSDIFIEGFERSLYQSAEIEFRMLKKIPPGNSLQSAGYWFEDDRFILNENFAIINNSLLFYFNPYEIGPYSLGPTELELKLTDYVDLIKKEGVLGPLLKETINPNQKETPQ